MTVVGTLARTLGIGKNKELPWGFLCSSWGDAVVCLPHSAPRVFDPVFVPGGPTSPSRIVGISTQDGEATSFPLKPLVGQEGMAELKSVLLATCREDGQIDLMTAMVGGKDAKPIRIKRVGGVKLYGVKVKKTVDDGAKSGVWRGFVDMGKNVRHIALELQPALRLPAEADFRVAGTLNFGSGGKGAFFEEDVWLPEGDRLELFASDLIAWYGVTKSGKKDDALALSATRQVAEACAEAQKAKLGRKPVFTLVPFGQELRPDQVKALGWFNENPPMPIFSGKASSLGAIQWTGMLSKAGDAILEISCPGSVEVVKSTINISETSVASKEQIRCRMSLTTQFSDGTIEKALLPDGPDSIMKIIKESTNVSVAYGNTQAHVAIKANVVQTKDWLDDEAFGLSKIFNAKPSGKRSKLKTVNWGGRTTSSGVSIEIHQRKAPQPKAAVLFIRETTVKSADGQDCQIVLSLEHKNGKKENLLLPAGSDAFNASIRKADSVIVVHNIEAAKNLFDLVAFKAKVLPMAE